eukprot:m.486476 g.486476  ORF g.486476 m.486476 type:complete len:547 (+) comp24421_c0_seq1:99-1739(+)
MRFCSAVGKLDVAAAVCVRCEGDVVPGEHVFDNDSDDSPPCECRGLCDALAAGVLPDDLGGGDAIDGSWLLQAWLLVEALADRLLASQSPFACMAVAGRLLDAGVPGSEVATAVAWLVGRALRPPYSPDARLAALYLLVRCSDEARTRVGWDAPDKRLCNLARKVIEEEEEEENEEADDANDAGMVEQGGGMPTEEFGGVTGGEVGICRSSRTLVLRGARRLLLNHTTFDSIPAPSPSRMPNRRLEPTAAERLGVLLETAVTRGCVTKADVLAARLETWCFDHMFEVRVVAGLFEASRWQPVVMAAFEVLVAAGSAPASLLLSGNVVGTVASPFTRQLLFETVTDTACATLELLVGEARRQGNGKQGGEEVGGGGGEDDNSQTTQAPSDALTGPPLVHHLLGDERNALTFVGGGNGRTVPITALLPFGLLKPAARRLLVAELADLTLCTPARFAARVALGIQLLLCFYHQPTGSTLTLEHEAAVCTWGRSLASLSAVPDCHRRDALLLPHLAAYTHNLALRQHKQGLTQGYVSVNKTFAKVYPWCT